VARAPGLYSHYSSRGIILMSILQSSAQGAGPFARPRPCRSSRVTDVGRSQVGCAATCRMRAEVATGSPCSVVVTCEDSSVTRRPLKAVRLRRARRRRSHPDSKVSKNRDSSGFCGCSTQPFAWLTWCFGAPTAPREMCISVGRAVAGQTPVCPLACPTGSQRLPGQGRPEAVA